MCSNIEWNYKFFNFSHILNKFVRALVFLEVLSSFNTFRRCLPVVNDYATFNSKIRSQDWFGPDQQLKVEENFFLVS